MRRTFPCPTIWRVVIPRAFVVALGLLALQRCAPARSAEPPLLLIVEQDAVGYPPDDPEIPLPSRTELDVCDSGGALLLYDLEAMVVTIPRPCRPRPMFADGFEGPAQ